MINMRKILLAVPLAIAACGVENFPKNRITRIDADSSGGSLSAYFYIDRRERHGDYFQCDIEFTDSSQNGIMDYYTATCGPNRLEERGKVHEAPDEIRKIAKSIAADYALQEQHTRQ